MELSRIFWHFPPWRSNYTGVWQFMCWYWREVFLPLNFCLVCQPKRQSFCCAPSYCTAGQILIDLVNTHRSREYCTLNFARATTTICLKWWLCFVLCKHISTTFQSWALFYFSLSRRRECSQTDAKTPHGERPSTRIFTSAKQKCIAKRLFFASS